MLELLNIHFGFLCRKNRVNDKGLSPIILRLVYRMERRDIYTGLYCTKDFWDSELTRVKKDYPQAATINQNLELIKRQALNQFDQLKFSTQHFTSNRLQKTNNSIPKNFHGQSQLDHFSLVSPFVVQ